ncbi:MAG: PTS sugar transporter subunit IIA [Eubacteriales bacterium]
MVTLESMAKEDLINLNVKADSKKIAIDVLADMMRSKGIVADTTEFTKSVLLSELESTINKGNGVALSRGKCSAVSSAAIAIGRLTKSISWEDYGEPVDIIVLAAVPEDDIDFERLDLMGLISEMLESITVVSDLYNIQTPGEMRDAMVGHINEF